MRNLALAYVVRQMQVRDMPEPIAVKPETISELTVWLIVVGMVYTLVLLVYVMGGVR